MKLLDLLSHFPSLSVFGKGNPTILGMSNDSRIVVPGNLFVAKRGASRDGERFIEQAVLGGAVAVLRESFDPFCPIVQIVTKDVPFWEGQLAARLYGTKKGDLCTIGVTGTKGKTTTTYVLHHLFSQLGVKTGLMGTVETRFLTQRIPSSLTTQDVVTHHKCLARMRKERCKAAILEVSSHGLMQGRVGAIPFDMAIFTNLFPDHLDYHQTMEAYAAAKGMLFANLDGVAIVWRDSPYATWMQGGTKRIEVALEGEVVSTMEGLSFVVEREPFFVPCIGAHNVSNFLLAIAALREWGASLPRLREAFLTFRGAPGRLERVENGRGIHLFVDFAHTGEALCAVLSSLREIATGKIIVVFGAGGDRDPLRRGSMGKVASEMADVVCITNDNPRKEDPRVILEAILQGCTGTARVHVELDRERAIHWAILEANKGDIVVIAGKGHEKEQIFAHQTIPFDDVECAKEAAAR